MTYSGSAILHRKVAKFLMIPGSQRIMKWGFVW
jgi:hypothetical protein